MVFAGSSPVGAAMIETLHETIVRVLTTHSILETEQGRSFPLSVSEANYAAKCLLSDPTFSKAVQS